MAIIKTGAGKGKVEIEWVIRDKYGNIKESGTEEVKEENGNISE